MYRKQIRRRRTVLAILIAVSIGLLTTYFGEGSGGPLHTVQRGISAVVSPIQEGANRTLKPARDLLGWVDDTFGAQGENDELRAEAAELRKRLAEAESAVSENAELSKLVGLDEKIDYLDGADPVAARVIGRSPTVWYSTVTIDKGSSAGLEVDQPVLGDEGLVGRVTSVTAGSAQITLITDHASAVSAKIVPDGASGVVQPSVGDPKDLLLDFIEKGRRVKKGQTVVTAGWRSDELESLFPRGIPIGRVSEATLTEQETYQRVHVEPFADIRRLDFVQVLTGQGPREEEAPAPAGAGQDANELAGSP